jgi:hypothetical protein
MPYGHNTFEVLPASDGRFRVLVNQQAIAEHSCPLAAEAHCERLKQQDRKQDNDIDAIEVDASNGVLLNIPAYIPDDGVITSGLCFGEDAQNYFDEHISGKPPQNQDSSGGSVSLPPDLYVQNETGSVRPGVDGFETS